MPRPSSRTSKRRATLRRAKPRGRTRARSRKPVRAGTLGGVLAVGHVAASLASSGRRLVRRALRGVARLLPGRRARKRLWKGFTRLPAGVQVATGLAVAVGVFLPVNWLYQVARKPSELLFPVSEAFYKTPAETWAAYSRWFERHSTAVMTPDFLAALAQVEGSGNPVVRTYWRFRLGVEPFEIYRPASSAVGMYQITDGTFVEARRYCIHDHQVVEDGPWHDFDSCWFNALYNRLVPSHAIEMTSAYLDRSVSETLARAGIRNATLEQKQRLAAVIHLCGRGAGVRFARRGLEPAPGQRCGDHDLAGYLRKVERMKAVFARLAAS